MNKTNLINQFASMLDVMENENKKHGIKMTPLLVMFGDDNVTGITVFFEALNFYSNDMKGMCKLKENCKEVLENFVINNMDVSFKIPQKNIFEPKQN